MSVRWLIGLLTCLAIFVVACQKTDSTDTSDLIAAGKQYSEEIALGSTGNGFSCITCHTPPEAERQISGHAYVSYELQNMAHRQGYWGTLSVNLRAGTNRCIELFMHGQTVTENGAIWPALFAYLNSISPTYNEPMRTFQTERYLLNQTTYDSARYESRYRNGDAMLGASSYMRYCYECHGFGLSGAPEIRYQPERTVASIAIKVRNSTFTAESERMPFFSLNSLPVDTLKNIISYLRLR